jgi:hypothetical protein
MSEVLGRVAPLTDAEKSQRLDERVVIEIKSTFLRHAIQREWTRSSAAPDAPYGYVEKRAYEPVEFSRVELKLPMSLDTGQLTNAILAEIARQTTVTRKS